MKILVVEDDYLILEALQDLLASYHHAIDVAIEGTIALQMASAFEYDLILLDRQLPDVNGMTLCQRLRAQGYQMPILMLATEDESQQKAAALNMGADDYVVKPFMPEELIARVHALLRRGRSIASPILNWGRLRFDPGNRVVFYGTHQIGLTPKEYGILELFLRNTQRILNSREILDRAWTADEYPGEEAVRVHIKRLRQKLKAAGAPADFIETVHRVGYRLKTLENSFAAQPD